MTYDEYLNALNIVLKFSMTQVISHSRTVTYKGVELDEVGNDYFKLVNGARYEFINIGDITFKDFLDDFVVLFYISDNKYPSLETAGRWSNTVWLKAGSKY